MYRGGDIRRCSIQSLIYNNLGSVYRCGDIRLRTLACGWRHSLMVFCWHCHSLMYITSAVYLVVATFAFLNTVACKWRHTQMVSRFAFAFVHHSGDTHLIGFSHTSRYLNVGNLSPLFAHNSRPFRSIQLSTETSLHGSSKAPTPRRALVLRHSGTPRSVQRELLAVCESIARESRASQYHCQQAFLDQRFFPTVRFCRGISRL